MPGLSWCCRHRCGLDRPGPALRELTSHGEEGQSGRDHIIGTRSKTKEQGMKMEDGGGVPSLPYGAGEGEGHRG